MQQEINLRNMVHMDIQKDVDNVFLRICLYQQMV